MSSQWKSEIPRLVDFINGNSELKSVMSAIGIIMRGNVKQHFKDESGPNGKWDDISEDTKQAKKSGGSKYKSNILRDTGTLFQSIVYESTERTASVGVSPAGKYGRYHQLGEGQKKREFMWISEKAFGDMQNLFIDAISKIKVQ